MRLFKIFQNILNYLIVTLYKKKCILCKERILEPDLTPLCQICREEIRYDNGNRCEGCGFFINKGERFCARCILTPQIFKKHTSYSKYDSKIRELILLYKYGQIELLKYFIAKKYIEMIEMEFKNKVDLIIPVPPDRGRLREYDTVLEIARVISKRTGINMVNNILIKKKTTLPQAGLGYNKRIKNLNGAFDIQNGELLKGMNILLIDDVFTTGTTIIKCSKVLSRFSGDIYAVTLAMSMNIPTE